MDFNSESDQQLENAFDEENIERDYPTRQEAKRERDQRGYTQLFTARKKKQSVEDGKPGIFSLFKFLSSNKKKKVEMFWVKLVLKLFVVAAVYFNFKFILNYMKNPIINFTDTLFVVGMCVGINFIAVWILFYKNSLMRFYLSLLAILGSIGYYFYVNYTNHSILGNNVITSLLVLISVLMVINPKINYYMKIIVFLLIPILGVYVSGNKFALVWTLMLSAGLILFFRVSKSKASKSHKKEEPTRRNKKQSA